MTWLLVCLITFGFGFVLGKHQGKKSGFKEGITQAPILIRQASYETGYCVFCQARIPGPGPGKDDISLDNFKHANEMMINRITGCEVNVTKQNNIW